MKKFLFVLIFICTSLSFSQMSVRTEDASGLHRHIQIAKTDTIVTAKYLVGVTINAAVAADSIVFLNGAGVNTDTVGLIVIGATAPAFPVSVDYGVRIDTLKTIKKKNSDITIRWRQSW